MASRTLLAIGATAALLFVHPVAASTAEDNAQIKKAFETEMEGASTHDIDKTMSVYWHSPEFELFDAVPGKFVGWDALKADYEDYFKTFPGKAEASYTDLHIGSSGDLGYAFSIQTWNFKKPDGSVLNSVQRVTNIYQKIGGKWLCIHEHASVPMDMLAANKAPSKS